jgi:undecaprenyl-diphosphatase
LQETAMAISQSVLSFVAAGDHGLMRRVHRWTPPRWIRLWMLWATRGGDGWLWYAAGLAFVLFGGAGRWPAVGAAGAAAGAGVALFQCLKRLTDRRRPCDIEPHCWANLIPPDRFSFPSGHSMTAFSVSVPLALFYPPLLPALMLCAVSVAASRILLGMHFLSDVIAGSALGALLGYAAYVLFG